MPRVVLSLKSHLQLGFWSTSQTITNEWKVPVCLPVGDIVLLLLSLKMIVGSKRNTTNVKYNKNVADRPGKYK
jgi:hypothetical protein